ncbi:hypothetical protein FHR99_003243 [Litorivivens lipolytica]|uniref:Uncharacterized protein n=1 Tax=Litorivivens lipolytica TaxID=1524264 RepID=A0A7W4W7P6_9GAMM|nr:hypothetical protein [Litorivivens lipolytica]MBB3048969.1 hypothetical protein [Litorivivens lipolytica]
MELIKLVSLGVGAALLCNVATAGLPHTFRNGEVADANHVNENFQALDRRIGSLESAASSTGSGSTQQTHHPYTRNAIATNIGDVITINGAEFVIVGHPFIDFKDNSRHILKFPVGTCQGADFFCTGSVKAHSLNTYHAFEPPAQQFTIDGYPAMVSLFENRTYSAVAHRNSSTNQYEHRYRVTDSLSASISLGIGDTTVLVGIPHALFRIDRQAQTLVVTDDADYRDEIDWAAVEGHAINFNELHKFFDYISVVDVPAP